MISQLEKALLKSWKKDTTADPDRWTLDNPAWGQCAVTACVVDDYIKSDIIWCMAMMQNGEKISHYFNKIKGEEYDATRVQFPKKTIIAQGIEKKKEFDSTRDYVLSFDVTRERYDILRKRVEESLSNIISEEIEQKYTEDKVNNRFDEEILNWVDSDWADDHDSEYEWYLECGRGEAENLIVKEMIDEWTGDNFDGKGLKVDLYVAIHDRISEHYSLDN